MEQQPGGVGEMRPDAAADPFIDYLKEGNLLSQLPVAVYVCDMSGIIRKYNDKAVELWGRRPAAGDPDERFCGAYKLYYPDGTYLPHSGTPVVACLQDGIPRKDLAVIIERPDLSRVHVRVNISPILDANGKQIGVVNCFFDFTPKNPAEKELLRSTSELQDYIDNANVGLHWVDENGIIKWANKAELHMLGYSAEEYIGQPIARFHVNPHKIEDILARLRRNETLNQYESELRCKDGSIRIAHISSSVYRENGKFVHTRCFTIDVTAQKRLFEELTASKARYKELLENLPLAVYTCNKDGDINFFNEVAAGLWGYRPDIQNKPVKYCACFKVYLNGKFVPPDETPMAIALKTGKSFRHLEVVMERPDGNTFFAAVNIAPLFDEANNITGAINIFQDISDIKKAELAIKESEVRYRELIHVLPAPLYTTDAEGRLKLYNKAAAELWGREPEIDKELWCGSYKILNVDGSNLPLENCPMAVCLKEQRPVYGEEILVIRPDGALRHVAPHPRPIFDSSGKMTGAINMLVDITGLKEVEKALRESEAQYRSLAASLEDKVREQTLDLQLSTEELRKSQERYHKMVEEVEDYAIILLDRDGIIQNWNKGAEKIKGYKEEEIVGKSFQEFYLPEDKEKGLPLTLLRQAAEKGKAVHEGWRRRKDGSKFWCSIVLTALHDKANNVIGFSKVTRDLTDRKIAEDRMQDYLAQLEFQNKELEQFTYAASHDLKEPLRKIHLYNGFIAGNPLNKLDAKSKEYLDRSIQASNRMKNLIEDLLAYSRLASDAEGYENVNMNTILQEIISHYKDEKVRIEAGELPVIHAIPFQIKQLLSNLVNNAVKYRHPQRDVHIKITHGLVQGYEIPGHRDDSRKQYHKISISDNGVGFDPSFKEKIFEIFQRLNNTRGVHGSGIGLAISKRIVQNHKGFIEATGKVNEGATFVIYIPS